MDNLFENNGADFSPCKNYRYRLWRIWDKNKSLIMFIGLNPSTANETENDATIRRVIGFARSWGYGGVYMMNCWPYVATKPEDLKHNPMSDEWNNNLITTTAFMCQDVVFAWGNFKIVKDMGRDRELIEMFPRAKTLGLNKNGSPKHPLYIAGNTQLIEFSIPDNF
jgi:hypothetical protein